MWVIRTVYVSTASSSRCPTNYEALIEQMSFGVGLGIYSRDGRFWEK